MASGFGETVRKLLLDFYSGHTATAPGAFTITLNTADPGEAPSSNASEVTGTNYIRGTVTNNTGWSAVTGATPCLLQNAATITFNSGAAASWTGPITHVSVWTSTTFNNTTYHGRAVLGTPVTVGNGTTSVTIAASGLTLSLTSTP